MRIIAGKNKGAIIFAPPGGGTRPTADKVRGAIFNILGPVEGLSVLDLFAGSGALGLEALSRGAARAVLVESRPPALKTIIRNITKLKLTSARAVRRDYMSFLRDAAKKGEHYDLIFVDPPYRMHRVIEPQLVKWLPGILSQGGRVVIESDSRQEVSLPGDLVSEKIYGDTRVRVFLSLREIQSESA